MEAPTYLAAINAFKAYECTFKEVPTDDKGMIPEASKKSLKRRKMSSLFMSLPTSKTRQASAGLWNAVKPLWKSWQSMISPFWKITPMGNCAMKGQQIPRSLAWISAVRSWAWHLLQDILPRPAYRLAGLLPGYHASVRQGQAKCGLHSSAFDQAIIDRYMDEFSLMNM